MSFMTKMQHAGIVLFEQLVYKFQVWNLYRRSGNFRVKKLSYDKFSCKKIFVGTTPYHISVNSAR